MDSTIQKALRAAQHALKSRQHSEGFWAGELELNPAPTAQVAILFHAVRLELPEMVRRKAKAYLTRTQNGDGGWGCYRHGPSHRSITLECYLGLRLLGEPSESAACRRARDYLEKTTQTSLFRSTEVFLGILGVKPWEQIQFPPIEILLAPGALGLEKTAYWVRTVVIPMALLGAVGGPPPDSSEAAALRQELALSLEPVADSPKSFHLRWPSKWPAQLKERATRKALSFIDSMTELNGDIGGNPFSAIFSLLAFDRMGPSMRNDARFTRGIDALLTYAFETESEWRLQTNLSTVWDTAFALIALDRESEGPADPVASNQQRATRWLLEQQIDDVTGDWARNAPADPGGWSFGYGHDHFPVTDCTANSLLALLKQEPGFAESPQALRAVRWLLAMQSRSGGWAAYENPLFQNPKPLERLVPFQDIPTEIFDRPKADVTAKVVEALVQWQENHPHLKGEAKTEERNAVKKALRSARRYLLGSRERFGLWKGNYGINYLYGTAFCCRALRALDGYASREWADAPERFFLESQNPDGGWGETEESYQNPELRGKGPSSPLQTAWALMGLCAAGDDTPAVAQAVKNAVLYLKSEQNESGTWDEDRSLGMVFQGTVHFRYELYPTYFPIIALNAAQERIQHFQTFV